MAAESVSPQSAAGGGATFLKMESIAPKSVRERAMVVQPEFLFLRPVPPLAMEMAAEQFVARLRE